MAPEMQPWAGNSAWSHFPGQIFLDMAYFSKFEIKVHAQSSSPFPSSVSAMGWKEPYGVKVGTCFIWAFEQEACLGVQMQVQSPGKTVLTSGGCLYQCPASKGKGSHLGVCLCVPQGLWGRYHHKLSSLNPELAHPEDFKYVNSKESECVCNAALSRWIQDQPGSETVWVNAMRSQANYLSTLYFSFLIWKMGWLEW